MLTGIIAAVAGVAFLGLIVTMQVRRKRVTPKAMLILPAVFAGLSVGLDRSWLAELGSGMAVLLLVTGSLAAIGFAVARAATITLEEGPKGLVQKGNWLTAVLWLGTFAVRIATMLIGMRYGVAQGPGEAFFFVALTFAAQNAIIARRAGLIGRGGRRAALAG